MLTLQQLQQITTGAVWVREQEGYFRFSRFTDLQLTERIPDAYALFVGGNAGMRLEFSTKGGLLQFSYLAERACVADCFGIDVAVNGQTVHSIYSDSLPETGVLSCKIPAQNEAVRVTVYLPNVGKVKIKDVILPDDFAPWKRPRKLLALGDSITQGAWSVHPRNTYVNRLADAIDAEVLNQGICGDYFTPGRIDQDLPFCPDLITVAYGTNDWSIGALLVDAPRCYLQRLTQTYPNTPIFLLLPVWRTDAQKTPGGLTLAQGAAVIADLAKGYENITVIDCYDFIPHDAQLFWDQQVHPNDEGFGHYAKRLIDVIAPTI